MESCLSGASRGWKVDPADMVRVEEFKVGDMLSYSPWQADPSDIGKVADLKVKVVGRHSCGGMGTWVLKTDLESNEMFPILLMSGEMYGIQVLEWYSVWKMNDLGVALCFVDRLWLCKAWEIERVKAI
ncbi:hypothetical protein Pfo_001813 [Paulownia fortunei]|nr:hypothetical protein Pfo_001813 [Paulownia fortunei]